MNRAEKVSKLFDKFGQNIDVDNITGLVNFSFFQPLSGQLEIASVGECWRVTFVCHGKKTFLQEGAALCVLFRKDRGECCEDDPASMLLYDHSHKIVCNCHHDDTSRRIYAVITAAIDSVYDKYFGK